MMSVAISKMLKGCNFHRKGGAFSRSEFGKVIKQGQGAGLPACFGVLCKKPARCVEQQQNRVNHALRDALHPRAPHIMATSSTRINVRDELLGEAVARQGGYESVEHQKKWAAIANGLGMQKSMAEAIKRRYEDMLRTSAELDEVEDEDEEYEVETIIDSRTDEHGNVQYLVKWKFEDDGEEGDEQEEKNNMTWEPREHLACPELLQAFEDEKTRRLELERQQQQAEEEEAAARPRRRPAARPAMARATPPPSRRASGRGRRTTPPRRRLRRCSARASRRRASRSSLRSSCTTARPRSCRGASCGGTRPCCSSTFTRRGWPFRSE